MRFSPNGRQIGKQVGTVESLSTGKGNFHSLDMGGSMYITTHQSDITNHCFNVKLTSNQSCSIILLCSFSLLVKLLLALLRMRNPLRDTIPILSSTRCDVIIPSGAIE